MQICALYMSALYFTAMVRPLETNPDTDKLSPDEFLDEYTVVEALIDEADDSEDTNLLGLMEEKQDALELENPRSTRRLQRERLWALDRDKRRARLKAGEVAIQARREAKK
jgi:bisphosphoglycerate-independent phosphoglycerate mutase (AlkP superfamily)